MKRGHQSNSDYTLWARASSLPELGTLTADWLEGRGTYPSQVPGAGLELETSSLVPLLAALNRAGYVTQTSQPGVVPPQRIRGSMKYQRACVTGFADDTLMNAMHSTAASAGLRLCIKAPSQPYATLFASGESAPGLVLEWDDCIDISLQLDPRRVYEDPERFRRQLTQRTVVNVPCSPAIQFPGYLNIVAVLERAYQVAIFDAEWGRNDRLWPALDAIV